MHISQGFAALAELILIIHTCRKTAHGSTNTFDRPVIWKIARNVGNAFVLLQLTMIVPMMIFSEKSQPQALSQDKRDVFLVLTKNKVD
jgi:hypothetical protein